MWVTILCIYSRFHPNNITGWTVDFQCVSLKNSRKYQRPTTGKCAIVLKMYPFIHYYSTFDSNNKVWNLILNQLPYVILLWLQAWGKAFISDNITRLQNAKLAKYTAIKQVLGQIIESWSPWVNSGSHKDYRSKIII